MEGPLPELHHLRQRQPRHNLVDALALPSNFYGGRFISDSPFLGSAVLSAAACFVSFKLLRERIFRPFLNTPFFSSAAYYVRNS
jgi:hypothetical protein